MDEELPDRKKQLARRNFRRYMQRKMQAQSKSQRHPIVKGMTPEQVAQLKRGAENMAYFASIGATTALRSLARAVGIRADKLDEAARRENQKRWRARHGLVVDGRIC